MLIYTFILVDLNIRVSDQVIAMLCQVNNFVATFRDDDRLPENRRSVGPDRQKCSRTDDFKIYIGPNVR